MLINGRSACTTIHRPRTESKPAVAAASKGLGYGCARALADEGVTLERVVTATMDTLLNVLIKR